MERERGRENQHVWSKFVLWAMFGSTLGHHLKKIFPKQDCESSVSYNDS